MTTVEIDGENWVIDGVPTHDGRKFNGGSVEGLLLNSRTANGIFDDANRLTRHLWSYPDTGTWDAGRNTGELISMLPVYRSHGLDAICVNLQGASPLGYYKSDESGLADLMSRIRSEHPDATEEEVWQGVPGTGSQPWDSGAINADGSLKPDFMDRAERLLKAVDAAGMVTVLGIFYFGQDERVRDETAVRRAVEESCSWVLEKGFANVVIEVNNECDVPRYEHDVLMPDRVHELIAVARAVTSGGRRLLAGTSFTRRVRPPDAVIAASDFVLLHGNGVAEPRQIGGMVDEVRATPAYRGQPVVYNEDDHFDFDMPENNFSVALAHRAGWGFFDPGPGAGGLAAYGDYSAGDQNPPVNWGLNDERKRGFFRMLGRVTGKRP